MRKKQLVIEKTPDRAELIKLMADDNPSKAHEAQVAFAAFIRPLLDKALKQTATINSIFETVTFAPGESHTIPVDPWANRQAGDFLIWSLTNPGGLPTHFTSGLTEYPIIFFSLDSAIAFNGNYVREARLNLMARDIEMLRQEFVVKLEKLGWTVILTNLGNATSNGLSHVIDSTDVGRLQIHDLNQLMIRAARLQGSWYEMGSIEGNGVEITDLYLSPERMADIRAMSYQPVNTTAVPNTDESTVLGAPDSVREKLWSGSGALEIWGLRLHMMRELGVGKRLTKLYAQVQGGTFDVTDDDLVIGMNLAKPGADYIKAVKTDGNGGELVFKPDNQFLYNRADKFGFFCKQELGMLAVDTAGSVAIRIRGS